MSMQTEAAGIPAYTPVVTGSVKQYVYKRKGCLVDRQIRLLAEAPRNEAWACRVERLAAALVLAGCGVAQLVMLWKSGRFFRELPPVYEPLPPAEE